jgi:hypothetical protein
MTGQDQPELVLCHSCGDYVDGLGFDDLCILCEEIEARVEAQLASAMVDYADHAIGVALDYLHPEDVRAIVDRGVEERGGPRGEGGRLRDIYERAHQFIDSRSARAENRREAGQLDRGPTARRVNRPPMDAPE